MLWKNVKEKRIWKQECKVILQNWQMIVNSSCYLNDQTTDLSFNLQYTLLLI